MLRREEFDAVVLHLAPTSVNVGAAPSVAVHVKLNYMRMGQSAVSRT